MPRVQRILNPISVKLSVCYVHGVCFRSWSNQDCYSLNIKMRLENSNLPHNVRKHPERELKFEPNGLEPHFSEKTTLVGTYSRYGASFLACSITS